MDKSYVMVGFSGFVAGITLGFLFLQARSKSVLAALQERLNLREQNLLQEQGKTTEGLQVAQQLREELSQQKSLVARLETQLSNELKTSAEKLHILQDAQEKLTHTFKSLSSEVLHKNSQSFLELAKSTLEQYQARAKSEFDQKHVALSELLKPVKETLEKFEVNNAEIEKNRVGAYEGLREQIKTLHETQKELRFETGNLAKALRTPHIRGRWGELQLKRVVEMAGMLQHCDFSEQVSQDTDDGRLRPDMVVHLPGEKNIVIDAKAPLSAYLEALESREEPQRIEKLKDHSRLIREHMLALGRKSYWEQFSPSPEFVIMFLPGETFFSAALDQDPSLIEWGVEQGVIPATPTTLIGMLRAIAYGWRQENLAESAKKISDWGSELYRRVSTLGEHFQRLGRNLSLSVESYNQAISSLETRVLPSVRKIGELTTKDPAAELDELKGIEETPRALTAPELNS